MTGMPQLASLLLFMTLITSCAKPGSAAPEGAPLPARTLLNEPYGGDSAQKMDIYLPAGRTAASTRALVLIHGGSWTSGNKSDLTAYIDSFRKRMPEVAVFNLNYRLIRPGLPFSVQEEDIRTALTTIRDAAGEYVFNKDEVVLLGVSAGAHLALLQGYKRPEGIKAIIDFFGPTDLIAMYRQPWHPMIPFLVQSVTGTTPDEQPELFRAASPIVHVSPQSPPTLIFHGLQDNIVSPEQSRALAESLRKAGVRHQLITYPNAGHGWAGADLSRSFDSVEAFLKG